MKKNKPPSGQEAGSRALIDVARVQFPGKGANPASEALNLSAGAAGRTTTTFCLYIVLYSTTLFYFILFLNSVLFHLSQKIIALNVVFCRIIIILKKLLIIFELKFKKDPVCGPTLGGHLTVVLCFL